MRLEINHKKNNHKNKHPKNQRHVEASNIFKTEIISSIFSDQNSMRLEINHTYPIHTPRAHTPYMCHIHLHAHTHTHTVVQTYLILLRYLCFIALCRYCVFYTLKVCSDPASASLLASFFQQHLLTSCL